MRLRRRRRDTATTAAAPAPRRERLAMPRTRGMVSGLLIALLGLWAALVPLIGPAFDFNVRAGADTWDWSSDVFWLSVLPGAVALISGLMLAGAGSRATGSIWGWLALASGAWLLLGSSVWLIDERLGYLSLFETSAGEHIGYFYGPGAAITALSAFALGRMTIRGHRDPGVVEERPIADVERRRRARDTADTATAPPTRTPG